MTHFLSEIKIKNYKSIKDETFELSPFTPLIGYNNAGKSNIIEAIKWLLRKSQLQENAFNDNSQPVELEGKIVGISQAILNQLATNHRESITPFLFVDVLHIKRMQPTVVATAAQIKLFVKDPANNDWKPNPSGIDQAIQSLFPEPIHIGAMEDAAEDVAKNKNTTTIGKLLAEIIGPIQSTHHQTIQTALDGIKKLLDSNGTERAPELTAFDTSVSDKIGSFFPGISVKIHIPTPELKDVFSKGTIKVFEDLNPNGNDISALGHGAQRSIQMALIRHLADIKRESGELSSNTLLLIDEPELFLHPQAIEILRDALKTLSMQGYQVIFSTHSPFMVTSKDVENTILIRKNGTQGTYKRNTLRSAINAIVANAPSQLALIFSLSNSSNILFSERVILAEGKTEKKLLPALILKVTSKTLGLHKVALVPMGGAGNTKKAISVLEAMALPTKVVLDLDYALKNGEEEGFLSSNDPDVLAIKTHLSTIATANGINLENGWPTKLNSSMTPAKAISFLAKERLIQPNIQSLFEKFKTLGVWLWRKGTIEDHLGGLAKNEEAWADFNSKLELVPLNTILPNDHIEITEFIHWIIS